MHQRALGINLSEPATAQQLRIPIGGVGVYQYPSKFRSGFVDIFPPIVLT